jgi:hypothetical protein
MGWFAPGIPRIPSCALPIPAKSGAFTVKKGNTLLDYAWNANWPIRQSVALTVGIVTPEAFEMSLKYDMPLSAPRYSLRLNG